MEILNNSGTALGVLRQNNIYFTASSYYKNANARTSHCMQKGELEYKIKTEETK